MFSLNLKWEKISYNNLRKKARIHIDLYNLVSIIFLKMHIKKLEGNLPK